MDLVKENLMTLGDALKLVRDTGYRVTKPKPRKLSRRGPVLRPEGLWHRRNLRA